MKNSIVPLVVLSSIFSLVGSSAFAATETWQGGAGNWNSSANWGTTVGSPGATPPGVSGVLSPSGSAGTNADTGSFTTASAGTVVVDPYRNIKTITFDGSAGAFTLSGGPLLLTGNGGINLGTSATSFLGSNTVETISAPIILDKNSTTFTNNSTTTSDVLVISGTINPAGSTTPTLTLAGANTGTNTISGIIQDSGAHAQPYGNDSSGSVNLTKTGAGLWILTAANTFSGTTSAGGGTLQLNNNLALQNSQVSINSVNGLAFQTGLGSFNVAGLDGGSNQALTDLGSNGVSINIGTNWANWTNSDSYSGTLTGAGGVTKYGYNNETFSANQGYTGTTTVTGFGGQIASSTGKLISTLSGSGTPFGTGAIVLNGGTLSLTPGTTGATSLTGATALTSGSALTYGSGSFLSLTKKDGSSSLTYTIGGGGTASLVRSGNGTLIIQTGNTGDLGSGATGENVFVNGTAPTVVITNGNGGMVSASNVGLGTTTASQLDFLNYNNTSGFTVAAYTNHATAFTTTAGEIANITSNVAVTDSGANPYAIRAISGFSVANTDTVTVGDGVNPAGIILGGSIGAGNSASGLNFGASEGIIYSEGQVKIAPIITGTGGLTLSGSGTSGLNANSAGSSLELDDTSNAFTGTITVNTGANLVVGGSAFNNNVLGNANNTVVLNGGGLTTDYSTNQMFLGRSIVLGSQGGALQGSENVADNISGSGPLYVNTKAFVQGPMGTVPNVLVDLTGHNTFTGGLVLTQGTAVVSSSQNLGSSTNPILFTEGVLDITGTSLTNFGSHPVSFADNYGVNQIFNIDIQNASNTFTVGQTVNQPVVGLAKFGLGTLVLTTPYIDGINDDFFAGKVVFYAAQGASLVDFPSIEVPGTKLDFYGGTVDFLANTTGTTTFSAGDVNLGIIGYGGSNAPQVGGTLMVDNNGGNLVLNLGNLRSELYQGYGYNNANQVVMFNGAALQIKTAGTGTSTITATNAPDSTGIYGGRVVYTDASGNTNWVTGTLTGTGTYTLEGFGTVGSGTSYTDLDPNITTPASNINYSVVGTMSSYFGDGAPTSPIAINSLKVVADSATNTTMNLGGQLLSLTSGGLLFTGSNNFTISNGSITSALAASNNNSSGANDLIIQQYSSTNTLTISAGITNNGSTTMSLTKAGPGTLVLSGADTYTGNTFLDGGTLSLASTNFGSTRMLVFNGGTLQVTGATNWTQSIASLAGGIQVGAAGATIDVENGGTLTLPNIYSAGNGYGSGVVPDGGLTVSSSDGSGTVILAGNQLIGGLTINGGVVRMGSSSSLNNLEPA